MILCGFGGAALWVCSLSWRCGVCLPVGEAGVLVVSLLTSWLVCWILVAVVIYWQIWLNVD